jgi:hypothetical protein
MRIAKFLLQLALVALALFWIEIACGLADRGLTLPH